MNELFKDVFYAKDIDDFLENVWKKHPNEASEAYDYFIRYYVTSERSIDGYRLFLFDKGMLDEEDFSNIKKISSKFSNYEKGRDISGKEINHLPNFEQRKKVFLTKGIKPPPRLLETPLDDVKRLRVSIVKQELLDADVLLDQWLLQVATFNKHVKKQKEEDVSANNQNSQVLNNLINARKNISFLMRRAAGLSDKAQDDILEEVTEEQIEITYSEVEIDTTQFEQIDYATLESFDAIINSENMEEILERLDSDYGKDKKEEG